MARIKDHLNTTPELFGWVITRLVVSPLVWIRFAIFAGLILLWLLHGRRVTGLVTHGLVHATSTPNAQSTRSSPSMQQLLHDIDEVRAQVNGLKERRQPERCRLFGTRRRAQEDLAVGKHTRVLLAHKEGICQTNR